MKKIFILLMVQFFGAVIVFAQKETVYKLTCGEAIPAYWKEKIESKVYKEGSNTVDSNAISKIIVMISKGKILSISKLIAGSTKTAAPVEIILIRPGTTVPIAKCAHCEEDEKLQKGLLASLPKVKKI